jgi:hypothetical protein
MRAAGSQWIQAAFGAPDQVAAQVGCSVFAGGTLETGQVGSHCQPQLISNRHQMIGRDGGSSVKFIMPRHGAHFHPPRSPRNTPDAA